MEVQSGERGNWLLACLTFFAMPPDVSDVQVDPTAPEVQEGDSLTLTCKAESNQDLEFEWLRDKVPRCLWDWGR